MSVAKADHARRKTGAASLAGGTGLVGASMGIGPLEQRINAGAERRNAARLQQIQRPYGYDAVGRPAKDPRARARRSGFTPSASAKEEAKELVRRKHGAINEFNRTKMRGIPLKYQAGRKWALAGAGGLALWHGGRQSVDKADQPGVRRRDVDRAAGGALVGIGAYQAPHYAMKPHDRAAERRIAADNDLRREAREYRTSSGLPRNAKLGDPRWVGYFRNYPKHLPGGRSKRIFAHTHAGKTGAALTAGAGALGAAGMVATGRRQDRHVGKALYQRERRVSPLRAAEFGAGAALGAWGLGRSRMVGRALGRGIRMAEGKNNAQAVRAIQLAQAAQGALARGTAPGERRLRQVRQINAAVNRVPAGIRPEVAATVGALLAGNSMPIRQTHYRQVTRPIPVRPVGW